MEISPDRLYLAAAGNPNIKFYEIESRHANAVSDKKWYCYSKQIAPEYTNASETYWYHIVIAIRLLILADTQITLLQLVFIKTENGCSPDLRTAQSKSGT